MYQTYSGKNYFKLKKERKKKKNSLSFFLATKTFCLKMANNDKYTVDAFYFKEKLFYASFHIWNRL